MKTLIVTLALASILATSAIAKTEKARAGQVGITANNSVNCGRLVLTDPDPAIRGSFARECMHHERPGE
jgi:hypothetical protein